MVCRSGGGVTGAGRGRAARAALVALTVGCGGAGEAEPKDSAPAGDGGGSADGGDGADSGWAAEGDPATVVLDGACPLDRRWGGFVVDVGPRYSAVTGAVADGVVPVTVLRPGPQEGDCQMLLRENPSCDPPCAPDQACDFDGTCLPYPRNQDLGEVRIRGLSGPVSMDPVPPGTTYFDSAVPHPAVEGDALVQLDTAGGAFPALRLHGVGPEPLVSDTLAWVVGEGDLPLRWAPPTGLGRSRVEARLMVDQHGLSPYTLVCSFEDDGEAAIPAGLIASLLGAGVSGFPSGTLRRRTDDQAELPGGGCADLTVSATQLATVEVDGHTPCDSPDDCPPGQICNIPLETCQ